MYSTVGLAHINNCVEKWNFLVGKYHSWRRETVWVNRVVLALGFAVLTGLGGLVKIYTPFTPVPFTLQTYFVLLAGVVLGKHWGGVSQFFYVMLGVAGIPWFAGGGHGVDVVCGYTGGYLLSFIFVAWLIGYVSDTYPGARTWRAQFPVMALGSVLILTIGSLYLSVSLAVSIKQAFIWGFLPFLVTDMIKSLVAGFTSPLLLHRPS